MRDGAGGVSGVGRSGGALGSFLVETWKLVPENNNYEVSDLGRVRRATPSSRNPAGMLLSADKSRKGYLSVTIWDGRKYSRRLVHRLVASAFISNPEGKETVNHIDGMKTNNRVSNLEWATRAENDAHARATGLSDSKGENHPCSVLTNEDVLHIRRSDDRSIVLARELGVSRSTVDRVRLGSHWTHI